jgi:hypothetical protein
METYFSHINFRILGGSMCYPEHVEQVWQNLKDFVELDALHYVDLFPRVLALAGDFLLRLLTTAVPEESASPAKHRYIRLTATQALDHPFMQVLSNSKLVEGSFKYMTPQEWGLRRVDEQLLERKKRSGYRSFRLIGA